MSVIRIIGNDYLKTPTKKYAIANTINTNNGIANQLLLCIKYACKQTNNKKIQVIIVNLNASFRRSIIFKFRTLNYKIGF